jgi:hypothetical protein
MRLQCLFENHTPEDIHARIQSYLQGKTHPVGQLITSGIPIKDLIAAVQNRRDVEGVRWWAIKRELAKSIPKLGLSIPAAHVRWIIKLGDYSKIDPHSTWGYKHERETPEKTQRVIKTPKIRSGRGMWGGLKSTLPL